MGADQWETLAHVASAKSDSSDDIQAIGISD